jgi:hypothetical protein
MHEPTKLEAIALVFKVYAAVPSKEERGKRKEERGKRKG